jgi:type II secretory ATPase GspE/PulE/Tfp pilus assembly ATPase PilB-like protein
MARSYAERKTWDGTRYVDLRMSLIWKPDGANSDVVLRVSARTDIRNEKLQDLGYLDYHAGMFATAVSRNRGIILVSGSPRGAANRER